jgi:hypothetical protein
MEPQNIEVLGAQIVSEMMGADAGGLTPQFGINAAAELLNRGVATYEQKEAEKKSAAAQQVALANALSADISWANAEVMLDQANQTKDPQKIMAAQALDSQAAGAAMTAGAALNADSSAKRVKQAQDMAKQAAEKSLADSKNAGLASAMRAWQKVASAAIQQTSQMPGGDMALARTRGAGGGSFMDAMRSKFLGIPVGGWLIGVPALGIGGTLLFKALRRRK